MDEHPLELSNEQFRSMIALAVDSICNYLDSVDTISPWNSPPKDQDVIGEFQSAPQDPVPFQTLLEQVFGRYLQDAYHPASPGYLAYIPGGGILHASVADLIAGALNQYVGVSIASPWLSQLEASVIRWFCDWFGYSSQAFGYLSTGGSTAGWSALTVAREAFKQSHEKSASEQSKAGLVSKAVAYVSEQAHHSVLKGLKLAGIDEHQVRAISTDSAFRIDLDHVIEAIEVDKTKGNFPWLIVGQAGSTNTGAVDDLNALAAICERESIWFHVDAAYGGAFVLTERGKERLRGIERADSIVFDPHKGLFLPFGTGCLLVKDRRHLKSTFGMTSDYMPAMQEAEERADFCELSPELSRDFRGLRMWLPIMMHGVNAFREQLDEKLDLASYCEVKLRDISKDFDCPIEVISAQLSVLAFRWMPEQGSADACDRFNQDLLEAVNRRGRVFLTPTRLNGQFTIRIAILSFRTHKDQVQMALDDIRDELKLQLQRG